MNRNKNNIETSFEINTIVQSQNNSWLTTKWRPAMGWMYMMVCIFDFILFPILWSLLQSLLDGEVTRQWEPLTLQGAGLFHLAMGAVIGITAYGRTQEKLKGVTSPFVDRIPNSYNEQYTEWDEYESEYTKSDYQYNDNRRRQPFTTNATKIPSFEGIPEDEE